MPEWVFQVALLWIAGLILILIIYVLRTRRIVDRVVGFDSLSTLFVAALGLIAIYRQDAFYFDIALALAMLGFAQTVAAVRLLEQRRGLQ